MLRWLGGQTVTRRWSGKLNDVDDDIEVLQGGVGNAGAVVRIGAHVLRPTNPHSATIHALLDHVRRSGFDGVQELVAVEPDGRERLVFIAGDVPIPPYPAWSRADAALASIAALMRRFHDATVDFVAPARNGSTAVGVGSR